MIEEELTNLMYELLSPVENPERGRLYLELFDKHVLRLNMTAAELDSAKVYGKVADGEKKQYRTKHISASRPIDLVIITNKRFIPIEVKIEADDQKKQCYDYWHEAEKYHFSESPVLYYLSPEGYFPSEKSVKDLGYIGDLNLIRSDKIDNVAFRSELIHWLDACREQTPTNSSCTQRLERLYNEIKKIICRLCKTEPRLEKRMHKFFTALDTRFDKSFCKRYRLKRGNNRRGEIGDYHTYRRYIDRFFGKAFADAAISLLCTDSDGNIIKLAKDKYLCFYLGGYNGIENALGCPTTFSASFLIFDHSRNECLYKPEDIEQLLSGKNILPEEFVKNHSKELSGMIGWTELHDAHGNTIDFKNVDKTLTQFRTQENIDDAVEHIMTEIKSLLRRFVNG